MGKWRNKGENEGAPVASEEVKKKAKAKAAENANIKPTIADESRQATAPEKVMNGDLGAVGNALLAAAGVDENAKKGSLPGGIQTYTSQMTPEELKAFLKKSGLGESGQKSGKPRGYKYDPTVVPKGENPDDYYTGKWRTGKKPTPAPAPEPPKPTPIRTGPMPLEDAPPFPGYYPQPKFPDRGDIGGGPGQFPYPMPMPQPSWPPGPRGGYPFPNFPPTGGGGFPGGPPPSGPIYGRGPKDGGGPVQLPPWINQPYLNGPMPGWPPQFPPQGPPPQNGMWL